jgi:hypothetical protein
VDSHEVNEEKVLDKDSDNDEAPEQKGKKGAKNRKRFESGASEVEKYTKPLREAHSRYLQYLRNIGFDQENNVSTV